MKGYRLNRKKFQDFLIDNAVSMTTFANSLNVTPTTVYNWNHHRSSPNSTNIAEIKRIYGVNFLTTCMQRSRKTKSRVDQ